MDLKKYLLYKLSSAQAEVATLQDLIASITPAAGTTKEADLAPAPANKSSVKKAATKKVEVEETEESLDLEVEETTEDALDPEADESNGVSEQDVIKAIQGLAVKMGKPYVAALLKKFKAKSIQEIKEKDYEQVLATIESTLKAKKK
jgi:hypothetical protein